MIVYRRPGWTTWHVPRAHISVQGRSAIFAACGKRMWVDPDLMCNGSDIVTLCAVCEKASR